MWSSVLRRIVRLAEGKMEGGVVITTRTIAPGVLPGGRANRRSRRDAERLAALANRQINFDPSDHALRADRHWRIDDLVEPLPLDGSGPPAQEGSWEVARELMNSYQLADPGVVTAFYDSTAGLRLRVGVRIGEVYDETRDLDGRRARVFGWSYRTLEGHFEQGVMHYELWKWLDISDVEFHLRAISRPATKGPLLTRIGFRIFGRPHQLRFYRQVCRRTKRLTEAQLETNRATAGKRAAGR
jgi:hypothetical protein